MRVLLVSANRLRESPSHSWTPVEPLGAAYVAAALRGAGHDAALLDLCFEPSITDAVGAAIEKFDPRCVGISIRNVDLMAYFNPSSFAGEIREIAAACRAATEAPIVLGGAGFSVMPRELLEFTGVEIGIVGEGERSFPELLRRLERGEDPRGLPGVAVMRSGVFHPPAAGDGFVDLASLARPARDLIDHARYAAEGGSANVQTKRGCPFRCIYCTYPLVEGSCVRLRPASEVADEFQELYERDGIRSAYIVDNQFNYPPDHARAICEELIERRDECRIRWSCMANPQFMNDELALLMRVARCTDVELSVESCSDTVLEALGKNFTTEDIAVAIEALKGVRLPFSAWVLLGGPGESVRTVRETCDFLERAGLEEVFFAVGLRICPGTELERRARAEGVLALDANLLEPSFYMAMDPATIVSLVTPRLEAHPGWRIAARSLPRPGGAP